LDAAKKMTAFRSSEDGLCGEYIFLSNRLAAVDSNTAGEASVENEWAASISNAKGGNAECANCNAKLGRFCHAETSCSCGAQVAGPSVKITAHRVDFIDLNMDAATLAARALVEAERIDRENVLAAEQEKEAILTHKKDKKSRKSDKSQLIRHVQNRGNYSMFRDKSFVPNASRSKRGEPGYSSDPEEEEA
jgi:hypothetical protein